MTIPRATMRLQFHRGFTFADAEKLIPYFARLGISHLYASPITTARPGSMHGYDVVDPQRVNPELGGEEGLKSLVAGLRGAEMGLIVDVVTNHMAADDENAWWFDVLRHGRVSRYAAYFDIDWDVEDETLRGKVLLPVLGKPLHEALRDGEISLAHEGCEHVVRYFQHHFPVSGEVHGDESLDAVLARQHYRLAWWRVANDEINWRRFFDINELVGLRMENAEAFEAIHALIFRLYAEGMIDGVRVDHIDGLADPGRYCLALRRRLGTLTAQRPSSAPRGRPYIIVEKILLGGEQLPTAWQTDGTSGYDFMNEVNAVQHDAGGEPILNHLWSSLSGRSADFAIEEKAARREIIARSFSAQLEACAASFLRLARSEGHDIARAALRRSLVELLTHFPVYRTYATACARPESDHPIVDVAARDAKNTCLSIDRDTIDRLHGWLVRQSNHASAVALQDRSVTKFQQLSAPVAAKAVEDTAFYRYGRLLSRNDVGFEVTRFAETAADFHASMLRRHALHPYSMLATATHDHKRGEDVRARLAVLSEYASEWAQAVPRWLAQCAGEQPYPGDVAILFQMIVGAWPLDLDLGNDHGRNVFADRLAQWQEKALREAKLATDWLVPDEAYERAARELLLSLFAPNEQPALLSEIAAFAGRIAPAGAVNSLAQTLLKLTAPGVPDTYQGTELWDFSLVDPDNRRPVDFSRRAKPFCEDIGTLASNWRDGRIKEALIARALAVRCKRPELFTEGDYQPLAVAGEHANRVVAFARRLGSSVAITVVPRAAARMLRVDSISFEWANWANTSLALQRDCPLVDAVSGYCVEGADSPVSIATLFDRLPFALLVSPELVC
jgi:(1->4)-alpha-D-glucan 1-alpha-D-glucosylmutase